MPRLERRLGLPEDPGGPHLPEVPSSPRSPRSKQAQSQRGGAAFPPSDSSQCGKSAPRLRAKVKKRGGGVHNRLEAKARIQAAHQETTLSCQFINRRALEA